MTIRYRFKDCVVNGRNVVEEWLRQQPPKVQARFASNFKHMAATDKAQWPPKWSFLRKGEDGTREFRHREGKVQYRIGAFDGPEQDEITLCSGWTHSDSRASQKQAQDRILELKTLVEEKEVETVDHVN